MDSIINIILTVKNARIGDKLLQLHKNQPITFLTNLINKMPNSNRNMPPNGLLPDQGRYKLFDNPDDMQQLIEYCRNVMSAGQPHILSACDIGLGGERTGRNKTGLFLNVLLNYIYKDEQDTVFIRGGTGINGFIANYRDGLPEFKMLDGTINIEINKNIGFITDDIIILSVTSVRPIEDVIEHRRIPRLGPNGQPTGEFNIAQIPRMAAWHDHPEYTNGIKYHLGEKNDAQNDLRKFNYNSIGYKLLGIEN